MLRHNWKFRYTAAELLAGAQAQLAYHTKRVAYWEDLRDKVKAAIKHDGIDITESAIEKMTANNNSSAIYGNGPFGMPGPQVNIKPEYLQQLQECNSKVAQRKASVAEYTSWVAILTDAQASDGLLKLDQADWLFFFNTK